MLGENGGQGINGVSSPVNEGLKMSAHYAQLTREYK